MTRGLNRYKLWGLGLETSLSHELKAPGGLGRAIGTSGFLREDNAHATMAIDSVFK
ncbi:MAG: hypothetical protein HN763_05980 [Opitutales bacterium]|nr:hypothetical protein [Opitutales bacterium]